MSESPQKVVGARVWNFHRQVRLKSYSKILGRRQFGIANCVLDGFVAEVVLDLPAGDGHSSRASQLSVSS